MVGVIINLTSEHLIIIVGRGFIIKIEKFNEVILRKIRSKLYF